MRRDNSQYTQIPGRRTNFGFTLVEIAIVLLIISVLLGSVLIPIGGVFEQSQRKLVKAQLEEVNQALVGFAVTNGRLPCPASGSSAGSEDPQGGGNCAGVDSSDVAHGFVPVVTPGLVGETNEDGLLLDTWANPLRYSVTQVNSSPSTGPDFTTQGAMRSVGLSNLQPNIAICTRATSNPNCPKTAGNNNALRANQVPVLIFSMGKDWRDYGGTDQLGNAGEGRSGERFNTVATGASGRTYPLPGDNVFVSKPYNQLEGDEHFDDIVVWLSENILYTRMIQAGVLP